MRWDESFSSENLLQSNNTELKAVAENMTAGITGISKCRLGNEDKYMAYSSLTSLNWSVALVMPVNEIIAPALSTQNKIINATQQVSAFIDSKTNGVRVFFLGVLTALVLLVIGISLILANMITTPIRALMMGVNAMGKGDLDFRVEVRTGDEFESFSNTFNKMASDLKARIAERDRFQRELMEKEIRIRELEIGKLKTYSQELEKKVKNLEIKIDEERAKRAVADITESEYFKKLKDEATAIRKAKS